MCKITVKKLLFVIIHVPDWSKNQETCDKVILENGEMLMFIPDCYKNQKIVNKIVDYYSYALEFLADCYKTQKCVIKLSILIFL